MMRFELLEPLRGIAALWVFCFHYQFSRAFRSTFPSLFAISEVGDLGVPMFFVVSGYCITAAARSAIRRQAPASHFLWKRLKRIYPPFWFSILVVAAIPFVIELISRVKTGTFQWPAATDVNHGFMTYGLGDWALVATLTKVFQVQPGIHALSEKFTSLNAVYWTLAIEVQFYCVVSAVLFIAPQRFYPAMAAVSVASLALTMVPGMEVTGLFFPYWFMFACGILLCWLIERRITPQAIFGAGSGVVSAVVCVGMATTFLWYAARGAQFHHNGFAVAFSIWLFFLYHFDKRFTTSVVESSRRWIRWTAVGVIATGAMSYSLYLLHGRLHLVVAQVTRQVVPAETIVFDIAVITVTSVVCYLFYWWCEKPFIGALTTAPTDGSRASAA